MGLMKFGDKSPEAAEGQGDLESVVQKAISEYMRQSAEQQRPALKTKLEEEKRRREGLERRLKELTEENRHNRQQAEQSDRHSQIRGALQELGVSKVQLAFRLVKDDIYRGEDGELYAHAEGATVPCGEYLARFVSENPEFLPPRIAGGSGARAADGGDFSGAGIDLDQIRPGMSKEQSAEAWKEVARLAGQSANKW